MLGAAMIAQGVAQIPLMCLVPCGGLGMLLLNHSEVGAAFDERAGRGPAPEAL